MSALGLVVVLALVGAPDVRQIDAERLAAAGDVAAARAALQTILDELAASGAPTSAALHYNVGTLALLEGDLGLAVVHLMAADRRDPGEDDVAHNLELALARRADQLQGGRQAPLGAALPPALTRGAAGASLALLGVLLALSAAGGLVGRRALWAARPAAIAAALTCALLAQRVTAERTPIAVVMEDTQARPQPDDKAEGFVVHAGLTGRAVDESGAFSRLRLENGVDVWVARDAVTVVP